MPQLFTMNSVVQCLHGGQAKFTKSNDRVKINGIPVPLITAPLVVAGCSMPPPPSGNGPDVAATILEKSGTTRVKSNGLALVLKTSTGTATPTGASLILMSPNQFRVEAQ